MKMPSKQQVLDASESCPDAKETLKKLFPEAFKKEENDVTPKLTFKVAPRDDGAYHVDIFHNGNIVGYFGHEGLRTTSPSYESIEGEGSDFKILKRRSK